MAVFDDLGQLVLSREQLDELRKRGFKVPVEDRLSKAEREAPLSKPIPTPSSYVPDIANISPQEIEEGSDFLQKAGVLPAAPKSRGLFDILSSTVRDIPLEAKTNAIPNRQPGSEVKPKMDSSSEVVPEEEIDQSAPSPLSILDFGANNLANQQALRDAQQKQADLQFLANMNRAAAQTAQGIARTDKLDTSVADAVERQGKQAVENYQQQVEFQKQDPNSSYSKGLKDYFKNKLKMEIKGDASAAELEKIMPFAVREYEAGLEQERLKQQKADDLAFKKEEKEAVRKEKAEKAAQPSDKQVENIQEMDITLDTANDILNQFKETKDAIGPIQGRIPDLLTGAEKLAYQAKVGRLTDQYRRVVTGAAAGDKELRRIESRLPKITDTDAQFEKKLVDYIKQMEQGKQRYLSNLQKKGKEVESYGQSKIDSPDLGIERKIDIFMSKNPDVKSREEALKILKDAGHI